MKENCRLLAESIRHILQSGFDADARLTGYIDEVFSCPSINDLVRILADDDNPERDGLRDLIFFPDEKVQQEVEDVLGGRALSREDVERVIENLSGRPLRAALHFSDGRGTLSLDCCKDIIEAFLHRLNLTRYIDADLLESVEENIPPHHRSAIKVKLRNHRKTLGDKKVTFLNVFFRKMGPDGQFFACLEYVLDLLEDIEESADIFDELKRRRRISEKQLRRTVHFEQSLKRDNIETLMMRGERAVHLPKLDLLKEMALIDHICLSVFGRTASARGAEPDGPGFTLQSSGDLRDLLRRYM